MFQIHHGDCLDVLKAMPDNSVDSVVCDPPYGLKFMAKHWDADVPSADIWKECLRVLKPGAYLLAFAGTRTQHHMAMRIENAGFEIRDMIAWVYGSGFPKSLDVSKAIDKAAGHERATDYEPNHKNGTFGKGMGGGKHGALSDPPVTDAARQWQGWGTALKPALEPITVARKPLAGTVAANVLAHGTGALNIDGCRVDATGDAQLAEKYASVQNAGRRENNVYGSDSRDRAGAAPHQAGRWPANLIHDGSDEVLALFPDSNGSGGSVPQVKITGYGDGAVGTGKSEYIGGPRTKHNAGSGSAARFYYCAKASRKDRDEGLDGFEKKATLIGAVGHKINPMPGREVVDVPRANTHATVKPTDLMRYLCRLVTPPGGVVLDPFLGSGSTGKAAMLEGFRFIGIEREAEYIPIAKARIEHALLADLI